MDIYTHFHPLNSQTAHTRNAAFILDTRKFSSQNPRVLESGWRTRTRGSKKNGKDNTYGPTDNNNKKIIHKE